MIDAPSRRARLLAAVAIGVGSTAFFALAMALHPRRTDFDQVWFGARALWAGQNPYHLVGPGRAFDWPWPLYYPASTLLLVSPLALLPLTIARAIFVGGSAAILAYGITRDSWARIPLFGSAAYMVAIVAAQWSPLMVAAACIPPLACIVSAKPNIGLAIVARDPSRPVLTYAVAGSVLFALLGLALLPSWPRDWLTTLRSASNFVAPLSHSTGPLLLLALLRWRRAEARLLIAMAAVPQNMVVYATLPLFLIPCSFRESLTLAALSSTALIFTALFVDPNPGSVVENYYQGDVLVALCYLPCLIMILRRPNEGDVPTWIGRSGARIRALSRRARGRA